LPEICGVEAWQYHDLAALRGDPSDNLPGVRGFGSATAARLLTAFGTLEAVWSALDGGDAPDVFAAVGDRVRQHLGSAATRETVERNRRLMRMRIDLPMPDLEMARLPLDLARMRLAFADHGIYLGPSLWALTGGSPPLTDEDFALIPQPHLWARRSRALRGPAPGQLALF